MSAEFEALQLLAEIFAHAPFKQGEKKTPLRGAPFSAHPRGSGGQGAENPLHIFSTFWSRCASHGL